MKTKCHLPSPSTSSRPPMSPAQQPTKPSNYVPSSTKDFTQYIHANYPQLVGRFFVCIMYIVPYHYTSLNFFIHGQASHQLGLLFKKHNAIDAQQYNSLKNSILQENTKFLDSAISILASNCICCSLRSLPCIIQNQSSPNIYRRKLEMTDSKGMLFYNQYSSYLTSSFHFDNRIHLCQ
jgi:hypothetical protein